jgi:hypothetical protein
MKNIRQPHVRRRRKEKKKSKFVTLMSGASTEQAEVLVNLMLLFLLS